MKTYIKPVIEVINLRNASDVALEISGSLNGGGVNANSLNKVSSTGTSLGQLK